MKLLQVKRIYVPLPDENVRRLLLKNQLKGHAFSLPSKYTCEVMLMSILACSINELSFAYTILDYMSIICMFLIS